MKSNLTKGSIKAFLAQKTAADESVEPEVSFAQLHSDIKPLTQDKVSPTPPNKDEQTPSVSKHIKQRKQKNQLASTTKQRNAEFTFSDGFEAHFPEDVPLLWHQGDKRCAALIKRLRRGDFTPEYVLDCHGMTKANAKEELSALLVQAVKQDIACVSVMHGHGSGVLKRAIPNYIMQYPHILGFCQAPKQWGGQAGILVLLDVPQLSQYE